MASLTTPINVSDHFQSHRRHIRKGGGGGGAASATFERWKVAIVPYPNHAAFLVLLLWLNYWVDGGIIINIIEF